jgi:hypothetical protein
MARSVPWYAVLPLAAAFAVATAAPVVATEHLCDPTINPEKFRDKPLGYRSFGDRCEGLYAQPVGAATMRVVSFTAGPARFETEEAKPISIAWPKVKDGPIRLRAKSLKSNLYYQMDTLRPDTQSSFSWPTNMISRLSIDARDLGLAGWVEARVDGDTETVYLPLTVRQGGDGEAARDYRLLISPGEPLKTVSWSIYRYDETDRRYHEVPPEAPQHSIVPRSSRSVPIPIRNLPGKGIYYIEIIGELAADGLSTSRKIWFYHPGG